MIAISYIWAMATASEAIDLLAASGIPTEVADADVIRVSAGGVRDYWSIKVRSASPSRWEVRRDLEHLRVRDSKAQRVMYVVPHVGEALREAAFGDPRVAAVSVADKWFIIQAKQFSPERSPRSATEAPRVGRRVAWGRFALIRVLLRTQTPRSQVRLAEECGITQVAVSKHLTTLDVSRLKLGWRANRPDEMWTKFMSDYPGPKGISTFWYALSPVVQQAEKVASTGTNEKPLISGDAAADRIAPWRIPSRAVVYLTRGLPLADIGFAESSPDEASLELVVPADKTIWATAAAWADNARTTDPVITAWDVARTGGPDAMEAVDRIRDSALYRSRDG